MEKIGIGGDDLPPVQLITASVKLIYPPPGFLDEEGAAGDVPGMKAVFEERVETAAGDVSKVDGR